MGSDWSDLGIVIAAKNAATTLRFTLESCRPIIAAGGQVVLVDGDSTDDTVAIADSFGVHVIGGVSGLYPALNAGFRRVDREWMTWLNADDLIYADEVLPRLQDSEGRDVLYGVVDFVDEAGRFMHSWLSATPNDLLVLYRAGYSPLLQQGTLFRRSVFESLHGFDTTYDLVADADLWWRALESGVVFARTSHPPVAAFRLHAGQLSQQRSSEMREEHRRMVVAHGGVRMSIRTAAAWLRFRGQNLPSYAVRILRHRILDGRYRATGSYTLTTRKRSNPPKACR